MRFLRTVFGVGENHRMFQEDVLRWKCIAPHPFWEGSRGYALRYKGEIAAFGCVVPCRFLAGPETVGSCNVIDWAASKAVPSAGIMLYKHIQELAGTMINIGGTDDARQVLPRIGFQERTEIHHYARVLRPWRHFAGSSKDWKSPLRLARDHRELLRNTGVSLAVRRVDKLSGPFRDPSVTAQIVCARTPESLAYFMACPASAMEAYVMERGNAVVGYFLLSRVDRQCRIANLWIRSAERQDWAEGYAAAATAAALDPHTTEVTAGASLPLETGALEQAGYRRTHSEPVFVRDPNNTLAGRSDLAISFLENDAFYWSPSPASDRPKYISS
jgi:hypothetical protein